MTRETRAPYYRDRARGLRVSASQTRFADIRRELQEVAQQFDRLADAAERRGDESFERSMPRHWSDSD